MLVTTTIFHNLLSRDISDRLLAVSEWVKACAKAKKVLPEAGFGQRGTVATLQDRTFTFDGTFTAQHVSTRTISFVTWFSGASLTDCLCVQASTAVNAKSLAKLVWFCGGIVQADDGDYTLVGERRGRAESSAATAAACKRLTLDGFLTLAAGGRNEKANGVGSKRRGESSPVISKRRRRRA